MVFRAKKPVIVYLSTAVGVLVGLLILGLFYLCQKDPVEKAFHHVFGGETNEGPSISVGPHEHSTTQSDVEEPLSDYDGHQTWFTPGNSQFHSAVLIAGSQGYQNYRHQADLCHAFQLLRAGGVAADQIITFVYDDIAHHPSNPYPGQIFNRPGGENVYPGCAKDYTGWEVTKKNVLAVLEGDERAVAGIGSGKVLKKDPTQKVFLFYTDHGSVGNIAMPVGPPIYADEFHAALNSLVERDHFGEMVIYLEACDAGSMFRGFKMEEQSKILAVTAADAYESSYATYCQDIGYQTRIIIPNATFIGTCLGDLFSVSWMEHTERVDRSEVFIEDQIKRVSFRTSDAGMYFYGSHVMTYGDHDHSIVKQVIGNFMSYFSAPPGWSRSDIRKIAGSDIINNQGLDLGLDQRQADLVYLYHRAAYENADGEASRALEAELNRRHQVDMDIRAVIQYLIDQGLLPSRSSVEAYATQEVGTGDQVVEDWSCLRDMVQTWESHCQPLNDYSRQYTRTFANLCNSGVTPAACLPSIRNICLPTINKQVF